MAPKPRKTSENPPQTGTDPFDAPLDTVFKQVPGLHIPLLHNESIPTILQEGPPALPVHAWGLIRSTSPFEKSEIIHTYLIVQHTEIVAEGIRGDGQVLNGFRDLNDQQITTEVKQSKGAVVQVVGRLLDTLHYCKDGSSFCIPVLTHPTTLEHLLSLYPGEEYAPDIAYEQVVLTNDTDRRAYEFKADVLTVQYLNKKHQVLSRIPVLKLEVSR